MDRTCHAVPFHTSASVRLPAEARYWPTAVHELAEMHDTPSSELPKDAAGFRGRCTGHPGPLHPSPRVTRWQGLFVEEVATASHDPRPAERTAEIPSGRPPLRVRR